MLRVYIYICNARAYIYVCNVRVPMFMMRMLKNSADVACLSRLRLL